MKLSSVSTDLGDCIGLGQTCQDHSPRQAPAETVQSTESESSPSVYVHRTSQLRLRLRRCNVSCALNFSLEFPVPADSGSLPADLVPGAPVLSAAAGPRQTLSERVQRRGSKRRLMKLSRRDTTSLSRAVLVTLRPRDAVFVTLR